MKWKKLQNILAYLEETKEQKVEFTIVSHGKIFHYYHQILRDCRHVKYDSMKTSPMKNK